MLHDRQLRENTVTNWHGSHTSCWLRVGIQNSLTKSEIRSYARHEFERNKDVTDLVSVKLRTANLDTANSGIRKQGHIRYLISVRC